MEPPGQKERGHQGPVPGARPRRSGARRQAWLAQGEGRGRPEGAGRGIPGRREGALCPALTEGRGGGRSREPGSWGKSHGDCTPRPPCGLGAEPPGPGLGEGSKQGARSSFQSRAQPAAAAPVLIPRSPDPGPSVPSAQNTHPFSPSAC